MGPLSQVRNQVIPITICNFAGVSFYLLQPQQREEDYKGQPCEWYHHNPKSWPRWHQISGVQPNDFVQVFLCQARRSEEKLYFARCTRVKRFAPFKTFFAANESAIVFQDQFSLTTFSWTFSVAKESQSDGLVMDSRGRLYFSGVTKDTIYYIDTIDRSDPSKKFPKKKLELKKIAENPQSLSWPDTFAIDNAGEYLWATTRWSFFSPCKSAWYFAFLKGRVQ